jgi:hypothetical protein
MIDSKRRIGVGGSRSFTQNVRHFHIDIDAAVGAKIDAIDGSRKEILRVERSGVAPALRTAERATLAPQTHTDHENETW